jgi:hypothetical protein
MRRTVLTCALGASLATSACLAGGSGGDSKRERVSPQSVNRAPTIAGSAPPAVLAGESYVFRPSASDPDGDLLVFSIAAKPVWARFDAATGRLSGRPAARDVGIYTGITISVSDGRARASLPAFDVAVTQTADGSVTLSWEPPTRNEDGSSLTDLAGYRIYMGRSPAALSRVVVLRNPGLTRYVVENLSPTTWYFAMTSFNRRDRESRRSAVVRKTVG